MGRQAIGILPMGAIRQLADRQWGKQTIGILPMCNQTFDILTMGRQAIAILPMGAIRQLADSQGAGRQLAFC